MGEVWSESKRERQKEGEREREREGALFHNPHINISLFIALDYRTHHLKDASAAANLNFSKRYKFKNNVASKVTPR